MYDLRSYAVNVFNRLVRQPATTPPMCEKVKGKEKFSISEALDGNIINFLKTSKWILKALHYKNRDKCHLTVKHEIIYSIIYSKATNYWCQFPQRFKNTENIYSETKILLVVFKMMNLPL